MRSKLVLFCAALLLSSIVSAQTVDCYNSTRAQGITLMQQGHYAQAVQVFQSAMSCPDKPKNNDLQAKINDCQRRIQQNEETRKRREAEERMAAKGYMEITGLGFANASCNTILLSDEKSPLYEDDARYIHPIISYNSLASEPKETKLCIKFKKPDGSLLRDEASPRDYTYECSVKVTPQGHRIALAGWGEAQTGYYPAGTYTCEIWCNGNLLISKKFSILAPRKPGKEAPLQITDILFFSSTEDGSSLAKAGAGLMAEGMYYLKGTIKYNADQDASAYLYVRVFNPDGSLRRGSASPKGFTYGGRYDLFAGTGRTLTFKTWGMEPTTGYSIGTYKYEIWSGEGVKLFATEVAVVEGWRAAVKDVFKPEGEGGIYLGEKSHGNREGWGAYYFPNCGFEWGWYSAADKYGRGLFIPANSTDTVSNCPGCYFYVGEWSYDLSFTKNKKNGKGFCYDKDGKLLYAGKFSDDKPVEKYPMSSSGYDSYRFETIKQPDGSYYIGETRDGKKSGTGLLIGNSGGTWFGEWHRGNREGQGFQVESDFSVTSGKWVLDVPESVIVVDGIEYYVAEPSKSQIDEWRSKYARICADKVKVLNRNQSFNIPKKMMKEHPCLVYLILISKSLSDDEKKEWFEDLYPQMKEAQIYKLYTILYKESYKLGVIENKYQEKQKEINNKYRLKQDT